MGLRLTLGQDAEQAAIGCSNVDMPDIGDAKRRVSLETEGHYGDDNEEDGHCCYHLQPIGNCYYVTNFDTCFHNTQCA